MNTIDPGMTTAVNIRSWISPWWRFSEYETRHGHILPAEGAVLETYDPWDAYLESRSTRDAVPPYQSLVTLLKGVLFLPGGKGLTLHPESRKELVDWCRSFGLLGLLPHEAVSVTLAPVCMFEELEDGPELGLHTRSYYRTGARWNETSRSEGHDEIRVATAMQELRERGLLYQADWSKLNGIELLGVPRTQMPALPPGLPLNVPPEGVVLHRLERHGLDQEPFGRYWGDFFPSVTDTAKEAFQYPRPLSPEFWELYAEPIQVFVDTAILFRRILGWLYLLWGSTVERDNYRLGELLELFGGLEAGRPRDVLGELEAMIGGTAPAIFRDERGDFHVTSRFPSLIAALAMMIAKDLEDGRRPRLCEECDTPFLTAAYQTRYCSLRCRNTAQKRRSRSKKREARVQKPNGGSS